MKLAFLQFALPNRCYCQVVDKAPKGVDFDLPKGTWGFRGRTYQVGRCRPSARSSGGEIIGVYDLDDIKQVSTMVHDAIEAQRDYSDAD